MQAAMRRSIDLAAFPDLVVVYLGFRLRGLRGIAMLLDIGPGLSLLKREAPDGLLLDEPIRYGWMHFGMRQYWRDLESLERFTRSDPHRQWWKRFGGGGKGAGFWHETYARKGGIEGIYIDMPYQVGLGRFAPERAPKGPFLSARERLAA